MIYLDHAATTRPEAGVLEAMARCAEKAWANPSSPYGVAGAARRELRRARQCLAELLNADPGEIVFTSGGTEANNLAATLAAGGHAVISAVEHASVRNAVQRRAAEVTLVPTDARGVVDPEAVARAIRPDTKLISVILANNETGVLQPAAEIGALARRRRIPFHCDAVQAFGHVPVDMRALNADLLSLSAHKFYGPRGVGALVVRQGTPLRPLLSGGGQEFGLRAGTENVPAVCGMRTAAELASADLAERAARERALLEGFVSQVLSDIPGTRLLCEGAPRLPGLCALRLPGVSSEQAIADLDCRGVLVSGGAACASAAREIPYAYRALGLPEAEARCVLRISIGRHTTAEEMRTAARALREVCERRSASAGGPPEDNA